MQTKLVTLLAAALLAAGLAPAAAGSDGTATLHFTADGSYAALDGHLPFTATCDVHVPAGASGIAVLDAAVASGCIGSYSGTEYPFGYYLECVNDTCGKSVDPLFLVFAYWQFTVNGGSSDVGVSAYTATDGDAFGLTYVAENSLAYYLP